MPPKKSAIDEDIASTESHSTPAYRRRSVKDIPKGVMPMPRPEDASIRYSTLYSLLHTIQPPLPRFYAKNVLNGTKQVKPKQLKNRPAAPHCLLKKMVYVPDMFTDALEELKTLLEGDKFLINWGNARHREYVTGVLPYYTQRGRPETIYSEKDTERLVFRGICDPALYVIRAIIHKGFNEPIVDTCTHPYLSSAKQKKVIPDAIVVHKGQSPRHRIPAAVEIKCHTVIKHDLKSHAWKAPIADALTSQEDDEGGDGEGENEGVGDDDDGDDNDDGQDVELTANVSATIFEKFFPKPGSDILSGKAMYFNWPQSKENLQKEIKIICQLWMQAVTEDPDLPQDVEQGWPRCPGRVILSTFASTMFFVRGTGENDDTFYYSSILNSAVDPVLLYAVAFFADAMGILKKSSLNLGKADTSWWSEKAFEVQIPKGSKPWSGVCPNHLPMYIEAEMLRRDRRRSV